MGLVNGWRLKTIMYGGKLYVRGAELWDVYFKNQYRTKDEFYAAHRHLETWFDGYNGNVFDLNDAKQMLPRRKKRKRGGIVEIDCNFAGNDPNQETIMHLATVVGEVEGGCIVVPLGTADQLAVPNENVFEARGSDLRMFERGDPVEVWCNKAWAPAWVQKIYSDDTYLVVFMAPYKDEAESCRVKIGELRPVTKNRKIWRD